MHFSALWFKCYHVTYMYDGLKELEGVLAMSVCI